MPFIQVFGAPSDKLARSSLCLAIQQVTASVKELNITEEQVSVWAADGRFINRSGRRELIILVSGLCRKPGRTTKVQARLAELLVKIATAYPRDFTLVECFIAEPVPAHRFATWSPAMSK